MDMTLPSDEDMKNLTHVVLTADMDWDPSVLDNEHDGQLQDEDKPYYDPIFDEHGLYIDKKSPRSVIHALLSDGDSTVTSDAPDQEKFYDSFQHEPPEPSEKIHYIQDHEISASPKDTSTSDWDWNNIRPKLGFAPLSVIKETISRTTQYYRETFHHTPMRDHLRTRFPAANVPRRHESVATDWIYSDTLAIDDGAKGAQIFIGMETLVIDVYGAKTDGKFVQHFQDVIRKRGAMDRILSDKAQSEISKKALDIFRNYCIDNWYSEPEHQNQNPFERRYCHLKEKVTI